MKTWSYILLFMLVPTLMVMAQKQLTWQTLADVKFEAKYFEDQDMQFLVPAFGDEIKAYDGKKVVISGHFIPFDEENGFYVLSKNSFASCYFCGQAGPETVMELQFKEKPKKRMRLDERIKVMGILELNGDDIDHCNYILKNAETF